jgi:2-polyprenyl-6-methoxyphenol hydroxylase-like FAD-dependent oxidoreductase
VPLNKATGSYLPEQLTTRLTSILPRNDAIVTQSIQKPNSEYRINDHLIWVLVSRRTAYGVDDQRQLSSERIKSVVLKLMEGWHLNLRKMVSDQASEPLAVVNILSSTPVSAWQSTDVTLLGDAIHTMTPLQGLGGSTALRDAGLLCAKMIETEAGSKTVFEAIDEYETEMIRYGFDAVRISKRFGDLVLTQNSLLRAGFRFAVWLAAGSPPAIKRYLFRR